MNTVDSSWLQMYNEICILAGKVVSLHALHHYVPGVPVLTGVRSAVCQSGQTVPVSLFYQETP